jgi:hypothetical protein
MSLNGWLGWDLSMYDFSVSFVESNLEQPVKDAIARWLKLPPSTSKDVFFMARRYHGLSVPSPLTMFKQRQATTVHMLKYSSDPAVAEFYELERRRRSTSDRWSGVMALEQFESARSTAGSTAAKPPPAPGDDDFDPAADRHRLSRWIREGDDRARWDHVGTLVCQGKALQLLECASHDRDWMDQVLQVPSSLFRFGCMALLNVLPTNSNLFRWSKRSDKHCALCGRIETTLHVLNNCQATLDKYTWRHNSVLQAIARFVSSHKAGDYQLLVDLPDHPSRYDLFPPSVYVTAQRPDMVFLNDRAICLVELTVPAEENVDKAADRKKCKYQSMVDELNLLGYRTELLTIEIGSRGNHRDSLSRSLSRLVKGGWLDKYPKADLHELSTRVSRIALSASFTIWLTRKTAAMPPFQPLLS